MTGFKVFFKCGGDRQLTSDFHAESLSTFVPWQAVTESLIVGVEMKVKRF